MHEDWKRRNGLNIKISNSLYQLTAEQEFAILEQEPHFGSLMRSDGVKP